MGKLDALWAFQQIDIEVDKFEGQLKSTHEYKRYAKLRNYIEEQRRVLQRMTKAVDERTASINVTAQRVDLLNQRYEDGLKKYEVANKEDVADIERYRKYFEQLHSRLAAERREFTELVTAVEKDDSRLSDMRVKLGRARKEFDELKVQIDANREAHKGELDALNAEADKRAKSVDPALLEQYKQIKRSHTQPVALVMGNKCGGCNMELPAVMLRKLKEDSEVFECESCGRLLYLE